MSLKDNWKETGKGIGTSFASLGKSIVKSAKVGVDAVLNEDQEKQENTGLKESWTEVGHNFGHAGKALGKAVVGTAKKVADSIDDAPASSEAAATPAQTDAPEENK